MASRKKMVRIDDKANRPFRALPNKSLELGPIRVDRNQKLAYSHCNHPQRIKLQNPTGQGGHGSFRISILGACFGSHGPALCWAGAAICTNTDVWQGSRHMWPQRSETLRQGCLHEGQGPEWQICFVRDSWWQSGGFLLFFHFVKRGIR